MERSEYRLVDQEATLIQAFPQGQSSDTVTITIYDVDDAAVDVNAAAMTNIATNRWKYSWTPTQNNNYVITFRNTTLDVEEYLYVKVAGELVGVPGGAGAGSRLDTLRSRFLRMIDNYNSDDQSGTNSSGDVADLCINDGLQTIYALIKASRYLEAYSSTALVSVASQSYIELSAITDIDEIVSLKDTTNDITLIEIPAWRYFQRISDPSKYTGTPYEYCRIYNRVYLVQRPTAAITYVCEYRKTYARLSNDSDTALIPSHYDRWIMSEAWVIWLMGEDSSNATAIQLAQLERKRCEEIFLNDIFSNFDMVPQSMSHWGDNSRGRYGYERPIDGT